MSKGSARHEHIFLYFDVKCASSLARSELGDRHGRTHRAKQHAVDHVMLRLQHSQIRPLMHRHTSSQRMNQRGVKA